MGRCIHTKVALGHCAFTWCQNYRGNCRVHKTGQETNTEPCYPVDRLTRVTIEFTTPEKAEKFKEAGHGFIRWDHYDGGAYDYVEVAK